jgi:cytochrome c-type biogenesis protein
MHGIGIFVAFLAGVVSFASPCCLPMVPVYVGYMMGTTEPGNSSARKVAFRQALAFVLGFSAVFISLWASVGLIGYALRGHSNILREIGGAALIIMGLHVAGLIKISALYRERRVPVPVGATDADGKAVRRPPSYARSALLGVAFAAGWTPCIGPILGGIIGLASVSSSVGAGALLLTVYALGLGVPFVLVAVGATEVHRRLLWFREHSAGVALVSGAMLVAVGFLMFTDLFVRLSGYVPNFAI